MIVTVTFTPEVELTFNVSDFHQGEKNRASASKKSFSGFGLNVSRIAGALGCDTVATGFIAGKNGRYIKDSLDSLQIDYDFTEVPGQVGTSIKIVQPNAPHTIIRESGLRVSYDDFCRLKERVLSYAGKKDAVFFLGNRLPEFMDYDMYADLCASIADAGCQFLMKPKNEKVASLLSTRPTTLFLTIRDLVEITGLHVSDSASVYEAAMQLIEHGAVSVMVSLGADGALYCSQLYAARLCAPGQYDYDRLVSGDVCVSAFACAMSKNMANDIAASYALAAAAACSNYDEHSIAPMSDIAYIFRAMEIEQLCSSSAYAGCGASKSKFE